MEDNHQMITQQNDEPNQNPVIRGLGAAGPDPEMKEKLMLFGQFVGDWDILEARYPQPDGTEIRRTGEIHFGWILDGKAVQDVWMTHYENPRRVVPAGTTIRFYDPKIDAWHSIWISPKYGVIQTFVARKVGDEIVLKGQTKEVIQSTGFSLKSHLTRSAGAQSNPTTTKRHGRSPKRCGSIGNLDQACE